MECQHCVGNCPFSQNYTDKVEKDSPLSTDNDNRSQNFGSSTLHLHQLPIGQPAYVDRIEWINLTLGDAQRLREFGFDEGVSIENMHRGGLFRKGVLACRVGRMTVALRREHADAIHVRTGPEEITRPAPAQS